MICVSDFGWRLFGLADLLPLVANNCILDVSSGGLILGSSHEEGGLQVIRYFKDEYYEVFAEFEGCEYILNANAT